LRDFRRLNNPSYSTTFNFIDRVDAFIFHNDYFSSKLGGKLVRYSNDEIKLWKSPNVEFLQICLSRTEQLLNREGVLCLSLQLAGRSLFIFSFLICNGRLFNDSGPILFLSRIQGASGQFDSIKKINMSMGNLSNVLLSALEGIALSLNIKQIICVSASNQIQFNSDGPKSNFHSTYDEFLIKNGALFRGDGFFALSVPLPAKNFNTGRSHRSRHKKHSEIRFEISESVRAVMQSEIQKKN